MASDVAFPDLASPDLANAAESADLAAVSSPLCGVSPVNQAGSDGSYFRVPAQFAGVAPAYRTTAEPFGHGGGEGAGHGVAAADHAADGGPALRVAVPGAGGFDAVGRTGQVRQRRWSGAGAPSSTPA